MLRMSSTTSNIWQPPPQPNLLQVLRPLLALLLPHHLVKTHLHHLLEHLLEVATTM